MSALPLTWNEALSGVFGSVSLAAWIFLLVPQLIENYRQGSADGISLTFLLIWMLGDISNLAGALWAGLVPTVIALAVYFCFADTVLILQCLYYNSIKDTRSAKEIEEAEEAEQAQNHPNGHTLAFPLPTEQTPLLANASDETTATTPRAQRRLTDVTDENLGLPGSRRRSSHRAASDAHTDSISLYLDESSPGSTWIKNTLSILLILAVGAAGWAIAWRSGVWEPVPVGDEVDDKPTPLGAEILGYTSAVLYLGARIPQIIKNQRERSCDGLSLLFFMLSLLGNATYGAGILFHSVERDYFLTNLPWLIGSLGTMAEDAVIFLQFSAFGEKQVETAVS